MHTWWDFVKILAWRCLFFMHRITPKGYGVFFPYQLGLPLTVWWGWSTWFINTAIGSYLENNLNLALPKLVLVHPNITHFFDYCKAIFFYIKCNLLHLKGYIPNHFFLNQFVKVSSAWQCLLLIPHLNLIFLGSSPLCDLLFHCMGLLMRFIMVYGTIPGSWSAPACLVIALDFLANRSIHCAVHWWQQDLLVCRSFLPPSIVPASPDFFQSQSVLSSILSIHSSLFLFKSA